MLLRQTNLTLGAHRNDLVTTKQLGFAPRANKEDKAIHLTREKLADLRKAHFKLGGDKESWITQYTSEHSNILPQNHKKIS